MKILIVEDTETIAVLFKMYLTSLGKQVQVLHARDGQEGLRLALEAKPALILSDVKMPIMDGLELCSAVRSHPALRSTPFVLTTSAKDEATRKKALLAGANAVLHKPVGVDALKEKVLSLLEPSSPAR